MDKKILVKISGMTCTLCSNKIEHKLKRTTGIKEVIVNFATEIATIIYDDNLCNKDKIDRIIDSLGFAIDDEKGTEAKKHLERLKWKVIISLILISPLLIVMIICWFDNLAILFDPDYSIKLFNIIGTLRYKLYFIHDWRLQVILVFPVQFIIGFDFYKNALYSIISRMPGMDLLVAIGTGATFGYSLYISLKHPGFDGKQLYFEAGGMIITFVIFGKYLEALAKQRTLSSIEALSKLQPKTAKVLRDTFEIEKEIEDICVGEIIIIRPGERIPLDGTIISGTAVIDESMVTGESTWVDKEIGDKVIGGTINTTGSFQFKVEKIGEDTVLSSIIHLIEEAQSAKPNIQKLVDRLSVLFVPFVLLSSIATFCFWYFYVYHGSSYYIEQPILFAVAVLVVSCPCALGLATPTAICIGIGVGAENGILIRSSQGLQDTYKINTMVFDKTGTITVGSPKVKELIKINENSKYDEEDILTLAGSLENKSEHPLGKSISEFVIKRGYKLKQVVDFQSIVGKGVKGIIDGKEVIIGNKSFLKENKIPVTQNVGVEFTKVYISIDNKFEGIITLNDEIKEGVKDIIDKLNDKKIEIIMVTGDGKEVSERIGKKIGIAKIYYEALPKDKAEIIKELKKNNKFVGMVGDGINDAPALAHADVAFAIGVGTDVAIQSSDIVIVGNELKQIPLSLDLSKKTMNKIRSNLFFALVYNAIGIPFAAFGKLSPELASACMALSSISVVLNSLSLKRFKVENRKERCI
ncbi:MULTISPECIES: heavy metal translocating P-type ATPase [unclassified Clostridium]|uniref:heavy metal translocating P-type ATPase n=1 Tax=unclassified Clostridium TaxID=2614128 RepID=UPI00029775E8|nr:MULTISPECIES: heavy metal translocating P-type ATPase [unclassified Clostridium]EKQ53832.1 MAG: copper/silver-translocating P-type ATPase [Clostridium sp. Maddingley MBC34-26]